MYYDKNCLDLDIIIENHGSKGGIASLLRRYTASEIYDKILGGIVIYSNISKKWSLGFGEDWVVL